ncbi:major facilitator superfamily domain-containing protein [Elsinoe ampelina]|uniref:Major facilitator superfamily domain-containing protein n=1 Tax=Elsinoe ampelina TaxID=302913 RepID=A0A6A6GG64_9PEZI|nr:major facilitator superfamily domain-containing protein [Elsinoe ampelina]
MADPKTTDKIAVTQDERKDALEFDPPSAHVNELAEAERVKLSWHTWAVVFIACFAIMAQVYVVVAAGSVIAFIIRDLGEPGIAGWIIQGPLLMQSVLSPLVGRLSDVLDRKYLASIPPLIAFIGAIVCAKASNMSTLIGGGILIGVTLATIAIVQAIPSEVLPLKYRALANGFAFMGGAIGGLVGVLGAGAVTNANPAGWRNIFWIQAAFHGATFAGLMAFYHPKKSDYPKMKITEIIWACDPIGSGLFVISTTMLLLGLNWGGGAYGWGEPRVIAGLVVGFVCLAAFGVYEWKGRSDGLVAHAFFKGGPNFALSVFAFAVEGWIFYSAVNAITPQIVLRLGFETDAWRISVRQLSFNILTIFASIIITWYSTATKDLRSPLLLTFSLFLIVCICYATIRPTWSTPQIILNVLSGIGQAGPLTLLVALVQFTAPHAFLSTATGLAFSARAIGGAFGAAALDAIINSRLAGNYASKVGAAATGAGLDASRVPALLEALQSGMGVEEGGFGPEVLAAAGAESEWVYADAYRRAWASIIPFVVLAIVAVWCLRGVKELMTERVEATVERGERGETKEMGEGV